MPSFAGYVATCGSAANVLRELVGLKVIRMVPCSTQKMVADALTKSLPEPALRRHRDEMLGKAKAPYCAYLLHAMKPCMISGG